MDMSEDERQRIEVYLGRLRRGLRGMDQQDAREIVDELRSHLID